MRKAIFLDRDGVINDAIIKNGKPFPPFSIKELCIANEVLPTLKELKEHHYLLIVATNQPDVSRGATQKHIVEEINNELMRLLPLDMIYVCYHDNTDHCECRKPLPGLLLQAAQKFNVDLANSYMIGDRWKDIEAGKRAGCKTIWINRHYSEEKPSNPSAVVFSLAEAGAFILNEPLVG